MWKLNTDLNKWIKQEDSLSKNDYDNLKQDLQKVRLWSKCLSGSTYLAVNSLDDIYDPLNYSKNFPVVDSMLATSENYVEFYDKYLKDSAFTLKTLFTSSKLISDQLKRYDEVDVATVGEINVGLPIYEIDGIILKEGHRVLVKDQKSSVTLSDTVDPKVYFSTTIPVSNYYEIEDVGGSTTYEYYNSENGIYRMVSNKLVRESDLDSYDSAYRFSVSVKLGNSNRDRQFHLVRGSDGYYPMTGQNLEFQEKHNWVLRNRVDYNNIYDINYYDILHHGPQEVVVDSVTYSVAERTISVGEFGVIINNQDYFPGVSTYSVSNVIDNKYKLNLNSVEETSLYYWVCGNEGTLLRISKIDFSIEIIELGEISNLMSVSFFDDLRGMVVGKFNTIYHTTDGGYVWEKITFSQFDSYSYNRVVYHSLDGAYVGGETGVFIEFSNGIGGWSALKRRISKELTNLDEYVLADDINDMSMMKWTGLDSYSYSLESGSVDFSRSLVFNNRLSDDYRVLEISLDSPYFGLSGSSSTTSYTYSFSGGVSASGGSITSFELFKTPIGISQTSTTYDGSAVVGYVNDRVNRGGSSGGIFGPGAWTVGETFSVSGGLGSPYSAIGRVDSVGTYSIPTVINISSPGSGYSIGDILKCGNDVVVRVTGLGGGGGISSISILNSGFSPTTIPVLGVATYLSGSGPGSGASFSFGSGAYYVGCVDSISIVSGGLGYVVTSLTSSVSTTSISGIGNSLEVRILSINFPFVAPVNSVMSTTLPSLPSDGDKAVLKLNGNTFTYSFVNFPTGLYDVQIGTSILNTLVDFRNKITSNPAVFTYFLGGSLLPGSPDQFTFSTRGIIWGSVPNANPNWGLTYLLSTPVAAFTASQFYVSTKITDSVTLGTIYENVRFSNIILSSIPTDYDMYMTASLSKMSFTVSLPTVDGILRDTVYSVETNIFYDWDGSTSTVMPSVSQTYSVSYSLTPYSTDLLLMSTNASKVILYDSNRIFSPISNDFVYFNFTQSLSDVKTVVRSKSDSMVYVGGDKIYGFDFTDIFGIGTSSNSVEASITDTFDLYANRLYTEGSRMYVAGNNSLLNYTDYIDFYDIDPTFDSRIKSKLLFLDYDIASKLNFFTDEGDYRLPNVISFSQSSMTSSWSYVEVSNLSGEYNWLSYYKDSEKVFPYGFPMDDSNKVEFSTTFSYGTSSSATVTDVYTAFSDISLLAPNLNSSTQSRTLSFSPSTPTSTSVSAVWFYKYLVVFKQPTSWQVGVGDVLLFESDPVDTTFMVNRIYSDVGYNYIYCYSDLNNSIINSIRYSLSSRKLTNLNRYQTISELVERFEKHPVSVGYEIGTDGDLMTLNTRFNNKTAYYNMQSKVRFSVGPSMYEDKEMIYVDSFMNFGYSPTFNLLNYLSNIDSVFDSSKVFYGFAKFDYLTAGELTDGTVWYDYSIPTNKLYFGKNLKFQWTSLLKWTFVDITSTYLPAGEPFYSNKMLIVDKYYDSTKDAYVLEFHKRIVNATSGPLASQNVGLISIGTRRTLGEISEDLQILNNMQRSTTTREIQTSYQVTNLENEIRFKFPTDSYFRGLISDEDIRQKLSAVVYVDQNSQIAMNVINPDKVVNIDIQSVSDNGDGFVRLDFGIVPHGLVLGNGIVITGTSSYSGYSTVLEILDLTKVKISRTYTSNSTGTVTYTKKDPFLNYIPIDLFDYGSDQKVTRSVEVRPENVVLSGTKYIISNIDITKYKIRFVDGVYLDEIERNYPWFLEAEVSDAVVGRDSNGLVWYSGIWHCGRWFGGTWISGKWISGDWYSGIWKSLQTTFRIISVEIDNSTVDNGLSKWYGGRWFDGTWYGGTWYGGRRYAGDWNTGLWYNGVWNDGRWVSGLFSGGVWILGKWESGIFNSNSKPSYWLDGEFLSGDFENGVWYDGKFGNTRNLLSRFGTKSTNSRTTVWNGGEWLNGQFHSQLNTGSDGQPAVSDIHKYSVWKTGNWYGGDFWGGVAYNINFFGGVWRGGILEEIQVIGVDSITPPETSNNAIQLNGIFRFNVGDQIWIIDDDRNTVYSPIGSNDSPGSYRINRVVLDQSSDTTKIYLNYNLSTLGVDPTYAGMTVSDVETGLRVVSYFRDSVWESGIWTNGIFETGDFRSGIWYNGIFGGNWGS